MHKVTNYLINVQPILSENIAVGCCFRYLKRKKFMAEKCCHTSIDISYGIRDNCDNLP